MSGYYPYLISSLPALSIGMKPPFSFDRLLDMCGNLISDIDRALLESLRSSGSCEYARNPTMRAWRSFETLVRNELVMIRASRMHVDASKYLRPDVCPESAHAAHIAINAYRKISPLEVERALDLERWQVLNELAHGHYFDVDTLIIYGARLLILEKWERIRSADGERLLEETLAATREEHKELQPWHNA